MAYDEALAQRIRGVFAGRDDVREQKMFGGIAFMVRDRMAVGVINDDLMVKLDPDAHDDAVAQPDARPMDFTGRPMRGMVYVAPAGVADDADLARWVRAAATFAESQPPKKRR
jgi:TfoX/Sxy family transcriptional regulator of competence genes